MAWAHGVASSRLPRLPSLRLHGETGSEILNIPVSVWSASPCMHVPSKTQAASRMHSICGASPFPNVPRHFDPCLWQPAELALPLRATATRVKAMSVALVLPRYKSAASPCSSGSLFLSWLPCVQRADTINTRVWDLYDGEWIWVSSVICFGVVKITKIFRSSKNLTSHAASSLPITAISTTKQQLCLSIHLTRD